MLGTQKEELKLDEKGMQYLKEIFDGVWHFFNPTNLEISGLGKIVATSTVLETIRRGESGNELGKYFAYKQENTIGEISRFKGRYYIEKREKVKVE